MKRVLILLLLILLLVAVYWIFIKKHPIDETPKPIPLSIAKVSGTFNTEFEKLLDTYFQLKDAFVNWDTVKANTTAAELKKQADSLPLKDLKADSGLVSTARDFAMNISGEATGIIGEKDIEQKRRSFYTLSEALYSLIRVVRYKKEVIYHQHCPMAFNDNEDAYWLSNKNEILNPYLGNKHPKYKSSMQHCGDISDSLDFRK